MSVCMCVCVYVCVLVCSQNSFPIEMLYKRFTKKQNIQSYVKFPKEAIASNLKSLMLTSKAPMSNFLLKA